MSRRLDKPDKKALAARAAGPPVVRRLTAVPGVGPAVTKAWRWWFERSRQQEFHRLNAPAAAAFRANTPALDVIQRRVLDDLRGQGVATVRASELIGDREPFTSLARQVQAWIESPDVQAAERSYGLDSVSGNDKSYLVRMFGKGDALPWGPWLDLAVHQRVLDVVNSYLELHARINYIDVWNTLPLEREGPDVGSQQWHRDPEAPRMVKVFTYFTDVTPDAGPLVVVPRSRRGERYGHLWPQDGIRGSRPPAGELERLIPASEWIECTVPAGTLVFADTSSFHRGGRARRTRRVLSVTSYVPPGSAWPRTFDVRPDSLPAGLPSEARYALLS